MRASLHRPVLEALEQRQLMSANVPASFVQVGSPNKVLATSGADQGFGVTLEVGATYYVVAGNPNGEGGFSGGAVYGNTAGIGTTATNAKRRTDALMFDDFNESGVFSRLTAGNAGRFTFSGVAAPAGGSMNWGGVPQDDHVYEQTLVATGEHFGVVFRDAPLTDNSGYMFLTLYKQTVVKVTATDGTASEDGRDPATFKIERESASQSQPLTVYFSLGGTATASTQVAADYPDGVSPITDNSDYTLSGATLDAATGLWKVVISAGQSSATVAVTPLNDYVADGVETVSLLLEADPAGSAAMYAAPATNPATKPAQAQAVINGLKLTATLPADPFAGPAATAQEKAQITDQYEKLTSDDGAIRADGQAKLKAAVKGSASLVPFVKSEIDAKVAAEDNPQLIASLKEAYTIGLNFWQPAIITFTQDGGLSIQLRNRTDANADYEVARIDVTPPLWIKTDPDNQIAYAGDTKVFPLAPSQSGTSHITVNVKYKTIAGVVISELPAILVPIKVEEVKN
jgi:hypothetical protein